MNARRTIVLLTLAVAALLGLAGPASAHAAPTPQVALTLGDALATGWRPAPSDGTTDLVGRPDVHVLNGSETGASEDQAGWDCRVQGDRTCGTEALHGALDSCHLYAEYLGSLALWGDPEVTYWIACSEAAYGTANGWSGSLTPGEAHAEAVEELNHALRLGH